MRAHEIGQQHLVVTFAAVSGNPSAEVKVGETAQRDALTGLLTRLYFEKAVVSALTQATNRTLAVLLIDLDRFKPVNDTLGHIAGDTGLRLVANRLQSVIRETDSIARLGGDEFALMIHPLSPATDPANLARRIVDLLGRTYLIDGHLVNIGASVGIAVAPRDGTQYESLLRCADLALHHSKIVGRGTYHFFSAEMDARAQARRTGELDLRQALALRQFEVHYQPQIDIKTRGLVGFEALVRWRHPEKGLIPPGDFLALAEEINVIIPLGDWVLTTACREAMKWPDSVVVAVNASPIQFETGRFADSVRSALDGTKLPARRLEIEVTEGVLLREKQAVLDTLRDLRSMGVRIAMDDFGTGHASLSQLARFSYDKIKIDRSLVGPDRDNTKNRAIVRAISALGASLGISTMAEGIETEDQLERIERDGCGSVQGYLFSKPMPASQLEKVISDLLAKSLLTKSGVMESQNELQPI
jgi:diguanylate cyclase (GGDEF)-like protein